MTTSQLLLIESNTTGTGREFARRAAALGVEPVLLAADPGRYPYAALDGLRTLVVDTADPAALHTAARDLAGRGPIAGVLSSSEYYVAAASGLAARLGLPGPSVRAVRACRDKALQRRALSAAGVPVPRFATATDVAQVLAAAQWIGPPVVVKPVQGSGSLGVRLCSSVPEAAEHARSLFEAGADDRGLAVPREVLVEAYLPGREFSVEVFGDRPVVTVAKHVGRPPAFVETGHDLPALVPDGLLEALSGCAVRAVAALGLGFGAAHVELRLDGSGEPRVVEVNPRLAGGMIPVLVESALGVDLIEAQVRAALGRPADIAPVRSAAASIRFLTADVPSVLTDAGYAREAALAVPGVCDAAVYREPGTPVRPAVDFRDRVGHVIAIGDDVTVSGRAADAGLAGLRAALPAGAAAAERELVS